MRRKYASPPIKEAVCEFRLAENTAWDPTHQVESALTCLRQLGVVLDNQPALRDYLIEHLDMIAVTLRAAHLALARFRSSATFHLRSHQSPESEDDEYLVLLIRQSIYDDDILDQIQAVWAGYDDLLATASGWLLVTTDFRPPQ